MPQLARCTIVFRRIGIVQIRGFIHADQINCSLHRANVSTRGAFGSRLLLQTGNRLTVLGIVGGISPQCRFVLIRTKRKPVTIRKEYLRRPPDC